MGSFAGPSRFDGAHELDKWRFGVVTGVTGYIVLEFIGALLADESNFSSWEHLAAWRFAPVAEARTTCCEYTFQWTIGPPVAK